MGYIGKTTTAVMRSEHPPSPEVHRAQRLFHAFHNKRAPKIVRKSCQRIMPELLVHLGELRGLIYKSNRQKHGQSQTFIHFMESPVQLACDSTGKQLYLLGGNYRVTRRGIEG